MIFLGIIGVIACLILIFIAVQVDTCADELETISRQIAEYKQIVIQKKWQD